MTEHKEVKPGFYHGTVFDNGEIQCELMTMVDDEHNGHMVLVHGEYVFMSYNIGKKVYDDETLTELTFKYEDNETFHDFIDYMVEAFEFGFKAGFNAGYGRADKIDEEVNNASEAEEADEDKS